MTAARFSDSGANSSDSCGERRLCSLPRAAPGSPPPWAAGRGGRARATRTASAGSVPAAPARAAAGRRSASAAWGRRAPAAAGEGTGRSTWAGGARRRRSSSPGCTIVVGGLSRDLINRIIQRHYNEVKYCYEKELTKDPALYGKVTVLFVIDGVGRVVDALVQQSTMGSEPVESCIVTHVRRWAFPAPQGGGTVQVTYPYVFKSSAQ